MIYDIYDRIMYTRITPRERWPDKPVYICPYTGKWYIELHKNIQKRSRGDYKYSMIVLYDNIWDYKWISTKILHTKWKQSKAINLLYE